MNKAVESTWSGREDSNLRPLPPEDERYDRMAMFSLTFFVGIILFFDVSYQGTYGPRFKLNLGPLSSVRRFKSGTGFGRCRTRFRLKEDSIVPSKPKQYF